MFGGVLAVAARAAACSTISGFVLAAVPAHVALRSAGGQPLHSNPVRSGCRGFGCNRARSGHSPVTVWVADRSARSVWDSGDRPPHRISGLGLLSAHRGLHGHRRVHTHTRSLWRATLVWAGVLESPARCFRPSSVTNRSQRVSSHSIATRGTGALTHGSRPPPLCVGRWSPVRVA